MPMRRIYAAVLAIVLFSTAPRSAHASHEIGQAIGLVFLFALDTAVSIGGTVTGIGSAVQLGRDPPTLGWSIASIVLGSLAGIAGAITTGALVGSDVDDGSPGLWIFAAIPYALCATNLTIGVVNVTRWGGAKARPRDDEEYEEVEVEEDEWSKGPSPGVGVSVSF